jgi:hypothetical protein
LANRRNIRSSGALSDILFLGSKVLAYSSSATSRSRILTANRLKVLTLAFLRKGDSCRFVTNNATIKLNIVVRSKLFLFLSRKLGFLESFLLFLSKIVVSHKESIVSLESDDSERLIAIE